MCCQGSPEAPGSTGGCRTPSLHDRCGITKPYLRFFTDIFGTMRLKGTGTLFTRYILDVHKGKNVKIQCLN